MGSILDIQQLATLLKSKRGERGLREIAEEIGNVSPATLSRIENGKMLDVETFLHLCDWLQVPPQQLIKEAPYGLLASQAVRYHIQGGQRLEGSVVIQGAKNAALPIIAASLLASKGQTILHNVPLIRDVFAAIELVRSLGAKVKLHEEDQVLIIDASTLTSNILPAHLSQMFRGSVLFLAPILLRTGQVSLATVGGCNCTHRISPEATSTWTRRAIPGQKISWSPLHWHRERPLSKMLHWNRRSPTLRISCPAWEQKLQESAQASCILKVSTNYLPWSIR